MECPTALSGFDQVWVGLGFRSLGFIRSRIGLLNVKFGSV